MVSILLDTFIIRGNHMKYTIHRRLFAHIRHNIEVSADFRKDIIHGLEQTEGKLYLNQVGLDTCSNYNLPGTEYSEPVSA